MHKKFLIIAGIVISGFVIGGCVHSKPNALQGNLTSAGRVISRAPAEFLLENFAPNLNPANLNVFNDGLKTIDCSKVLTRTETFQGRSYTKFDISEVAYLACPQVKAMKTQRTWKVKRPAWDSADEYEYKLFIKGLAASGCNTTDKCLSGPGNILRTEEDMLNTFYTDCADFPYYLRAYFSYKKNLPMSYVLEIRQAPFTEAQIHSITEERNATFNKAQVEAGARFDKQYTPEQLVNLTAERQAAVDQAGNEALQKFDGQIRDLRYSRNGNIPVSRFSIPSRTPVARDIGVIGQRITDIISSGFLRMTSAPPGSPVQTDFYSPQIRPGVIDAGTVLYNVSGHVAVVYDVTPKGEVKFIDAHPDNSISRGSFNLDYRVVKSDYGGNFKNFRPIQVVNPTLDSEGTIVTGQIAVANDDEIPEYSLEQYTGDGVDASGKGIFKLSPEQTTGVDFQDWVKFRLSGGKYRLEPTVEMKNEVDALCAMVNTRVHTMDLVARNKIHLMPHPYNLPQNIYGADGLWESYSSPGSDIRLRAKILNIAEAAKTWMKRYRSQDPLVSYSGANLKTDLVAAYQAAAASCKFSYRNSSGAPVALTLEKLIARIGLLSFDPYNCPELRWGANTPAELASCTDDAQKKEWYKYQQFLRNVTEKDTKSVHGYTLDQLKEMDLNGSVNNKDNSSKYNIVNKLMAL